jgi:hypothetical protein
MHDRGSANVKLADLSRRQNRAVLPHRECLDSGDRSADRDRARRLVGAPRYLVPGADVRLGRPEKIREASVGENLHHLVQVFRREYLAGEEDRAQGGRLCLLQAAAQHEHCEDRRHRVPDGDPCVANPPGKLNREERQLLWNKHNRRSGLRGREQIEHRKVEVKGCVAREAILLRDAELLGRPVHERHRVQMGEHDALRHTGRSGRVEDVREVRVGARQLRRTVGGMVIEGRGRHDIESVGGSELTVLGVEDNQGLDGSTFGEERCPYARLGLARDEEAQAGVTRDQAKSRGRRSWIQWDVRRARFEDPVDPDQRLERLVEVKAHSVASPDRPCREQVGKAIRSRVEFRVCHRSLAVDDRRPRRETLRGGAEQVVNE